MSGKNWYFEKGIRILNQSLGRIVRHRRDYGLIFFCDNRIQSFPLNTKISSWIKKRGVKKLSYTESLSLQKKFFSKEYDNKRNYRFTIKKPSKGKQNKKIYSLFNLKKIKKKI